MGEQTAVAPLWGGKISLENIEWRSKDVLVQRLVVQAARLSAGEKGSPYSAGRPNEA